MTHAAIPEADVLACFQQGTRATHRYTLGHHRLYALADSHLIVIISLPITCSAQVADVVLGCLNVVHPILHLLKRRLKQKTWLDLFLILKFRQLIKHAWRACQQAKLISRRRLQQRCLSNRWSSHRQRTTDSIICHAASP